jgi:phospholipase C
MREYDNFAADLGKGNVPAVVYLKSRSGEDEHPGSPLTADFAVKTINAIMGNDVWKDSVIILTYDESGGLWDHVPPPQVDAGPDGLQGLGPRIPALVISPYAKKNFVSHVQYDTTSVLKFIEWNFGLAPLNNRDANANNLLDMLDFGHPDFTPYKVTGAAAMPKSSNGTSVNVKLNNALLTASSEKTAPFQTKAGVTLVSLRDLARNINAEFVGGKNSAILIAGGHSFEFAGNSNTALVDGAGKKLADKVWSGQDQELFISLPSLAKLPGFAVDPSGDTPTITVAGEGSR